MRQLFFLAAVLSASLAHGQFVLDSGSGGTLFAAAAINGPTVSQQMPVGFDGNTSAIAIAVDDSGNQGQASAQSTINRLGDVWQISGNTAASGVYSYGCSAILSIYFHPTKSETLSINGSLTALGAGHSSFGVGVASTSISLTGPGVSQSWSHQDDTGLLFPVPIGYIWQADAGAVYRVDISTSASGSSPVVGTIGSVAPSSYSLTLQSVPELPGAALGAVGILTLAAAWRKVNQRSSDSADDPKARC